MSRGGGSQGEGCGAWPGPSKPGPQVPAQKRNINTNLAGGCSSGSQMAGEGRQWLRMAEPSQELLVSPEAPKCWEEAGTQDQHARNQRQALWHCRLTPPLVTPPHPKERWSPSTSTTRDSELPQFSP